MDATTLRSCLAGILPPVTTPFDDRGDLDLGALAANVERYNAADLAGYLAFGSNGEAVHLLPEERRQVLATLRQKAAPGRLLVAGVNEQSTRGALAAIHEAAGEGADAALVITPYFYKSSLTQDVLRGFFLDLAEASPLPLLLYNIPQNTGVTLQPETTAALAAHPRIVGIKDSSGNLAALAEVVRLAPPGFTTLVGSAAILFPALLMGVDGAILALACVAPEGCVAVQSAVRAGDHARARDLQQRLSPLAALVTSGLGVAGLKAALDLAGFHGGPPRRPLLPVSPADRARIAAALAASGCVEGLLSISER